MRLVGTSLECYKYLEPLYNDYRKMRTKDKVGGKIIHFGTREEIFVKFFFVFFYSGNHPNINDMKCIHFTKQTWKTVLLLYIST